MLASDRAKQAHFGESVSISGDYAIIAAHGEEHDATGGDSIFRAGAAYLFERDGGGNWSQVQRLVGSDRGVNYNFGLSVSISGDYAIVGASHDDEGAIGGDSIDAAGAAYLFERDGGGNWMNVQKLVASDRALGDIFGVAVSISGNYTIVGAFGEDEDAAGGDSIDAAGSAYLFERDSVGNWMQVQKIVAADRAAIDWFGFSVSINSDYAIVGAPNKDNTGRQLPFLRDGAGSAYVFERDTSGNWMQVRKIVASDSASADWFGCSVSINGNYGVIGALQHDEVDTGGYNLNDAGSAYLFERCPVNISVSQIGFTLSSNALGATYQWLDCNMDYAAIAGETNQSFTAAANGNYAVEVTRGICTDTSACFTITGIGILKNDLGSDLTVYPNPSTGKITIKLGQTYSGLTLSIRNLSGQLISSMNFETAYQLDIEIEGPAAYYLIEISTAEGRSAVVRVLKE